MSEYIEYIVFSCHVMSKRSFDNNLFLEYRVFWHRYPKKKEHQKKTKQDQTIKIKSESTKNIP